MIYEGIKKILIAGIVGTLLVHGTGKVPVARAEIIMGGNGYEDSETGNIAEDVEDEIRYEKERLYIDDFETI